MKPAHLAAVVAASAFSMPLGAQTCGGVQDLGTLGAGSHALGVSDAGDVVVGWSNTSTFGWSAYRWTPATGMLDLGLGGFRSEARGVSGDGLVVVGSIQMTPGDARAFRWTEATGVQDLGTLPGFTRATATAASYDGSVVVGTCLGPAVTHLAFRWTAATGMQSLGFPDASDVSADGSVVVGYSYTSQRAFRWTALGGAQDIGTLGGPTASAHGVSADGQVVVGTSRTLTGEDRAFRWVAIGGMQDLGTLGGIGSYARGVSADGLAVVGDSAPGPGHNHAFRWTASGGMQDLGVGGGGLSEGFGASIDGTIVVGTDYTLGRAFRIALGQLGVPFCANAIPNSTSCVGRMRVSGSSVVSANAVTLSVEYLSLNSFGFFLTSRDQGSTFPVSNSQGRLCLGGFIGRFVGPGQIRNSGAAGTFSLAIDLSAMPTSFGSVAVQPGETWHFQAWHRDANPTLTSNFTDAVSVVFQ